MHNFKPFVWHGMAWQLDIYIIAGSRRRRWKAHHRSESCLCRTSREEIVRGLDVVYCKIRILFDFMRAFQSLMMADSLTGLGTSKHCHSKLLQDGSPQ